MPVTHWIITMDESYYECQRESEVYYVLIFRLHSFTKENNDLRVRFGDSHLTFKKLSLKTFEILVASIVMFLSSFFILIKCHLLCEV